MKRFFIIWILCLVILLIGCRQEKAYDFVSFEKKLEGLRQNLKIPAFSVAIAQNNEILWAKGFGYADIENKILAIEDTPYMLASLTKTFASTIILQLVEEGKVNLDDPISKYGINLDRARENKMDVWNEDSIKVKHLFSHTAQGRPGSYYRYSGYLFGFLDEVIEKGSGHTFAELLVQNIIEPLELQNTAPNIRDTVNFELMGKSFDEFYISLAKPYILDSLFQIKESRYESYFGISAGLMISAVDMAKYSLAIDENKFLNKETQELAFSPFIGINGDTLPYGLGWFVSNYKKVKFVWHYGLWNTNSSLIIKVPEKELTFVILANSNNLTKPSLLGSGELLTSQFALEFIKAFILKDEDLPEVNYKLAQDEIKKQWQTARNTKYTDLFEKELFAHARMYASVGEYERATKLMKIFQSTYVLQLPEKFSDMYLLAKIDSVKDSEDRSISFNLEESSNIDVFSIGEGQGKEMWDYGWIENVTDKKIIWQMNATKTAYAGGAEKNRLIDTTLVLPAGTYLLRYKSDNSHSYDLWNDLPPAYDFYGIMVYRQ
jgi:CubicO group peptidase (beta-lactamase class C family)